ncbi:serine hydrolase [Sporolactobacillus spathodeae]|uniref:Beta-lactamase class A n=1 Tax=Sporolactobacillus spathodeae TaxID=1465502 RepID=A0ABS2Q7J9_9BACL|nr:serine hydrolase [Sporolactobacillus spathodeae]MBM7657767.1 beta-lactamase class A [Sporolactobacillus spathodeae]
MKRIYPFILPFFCLVLVSALFSSMVTPVKAQGKVAPKLSAKGKAAIVSYIRHSGGSITLVYRDLTTGDAYSINGSAPHHAASTIKLPLVMDVMNLVSHHKLSLKQKLTYHRYQYCDGSGVIQYHKVGSKYTIADLIKKAVEYSDNIAFIMLEDRVGRSQFHHYIKQIGGKYSYPRGINMTSAQDLTTFITKLYHDAKSNAYDRQLVTYLQHTKYNATIPAGIKGTVVAHKVGWMPELKVSNDVAIVYDKHPYTLSILTNGFVYSHSTKVIAQLASLVNNYHKQKYHE